MALISDTEQEAALKFLQELCNLESGLSEWEIGFIESLAKWNNNFTDKQYTVLRRIWAEKVDGQSRDDAKDFAEARETGESELKAPPAGPDREPLVNTDEDIPF